MSTSLSRPLPSRDNPLLNAAISGAAVALGILTTLVLTGQWSLVSTTVSGALTQVGRWLGATPAADSRVYWYMARSAGIVAYLLLWGSVAWGILVSSKLLTGILKPLAVYELHQFLSILALIVGMFHGLILLGDSYIRFSLLDILIPFRSSYQPVWVGLGTLGLYLMAMLVASFYVKKHIGHRVWRVLHYSSFGVWIMITLHGVMAGTDSALPLMQLLYVAAIASVGGLLMYRVAATDQPARARAR